MHRPSYLRLVFAVVLVALGAACPDRGFPGEEEMGTFELTAFVGARAAGECDFAEMPTEDFTFRGIFSRNPDGETFFTLNDHDRTATFDGQIARTRETAARRFEDCECPDDTAVEETLEVALLSRSQLDRYRELNPGSTGCPPDALTGGVPPIGGAVTGPGSTPQGFDAVLACGELSDTLLVGSNSCQCSACTSRYRVQGVRR